jgi:hypothetical protein
MPGKNTIVQPQPNLAQQPRVDFHKSKFDALVWQKGNQVNWERAIKCPCKSEGGPSVPSCRNCHGIGWIFTDLVETRMVVQSINRNTKMKSWSLELLGTMGVTALAENSLGFMDRITLKKVYTIYSQVVYPRLSAQGKFFAFTVYPVTKILYASLYNGYKTKLVRIDPNNIIIREGFLFFVIPGLAQGMAVTLRYEHHPSFNILDLQREVMSTEVVDKKTGGRLTDDVMPVHAIARRSQYIFDAENLAGNLNVYDNINDEMETPVGTQ